MYKIEDFKPGSLLYIHYVFSDNVLSEVIIAEVYKTESGSDPFKNKIWVNDIWKDDGELGEKEFIYLDDFNALYDKTHEESYIHILIDECHHPELTKLISEHPEVQEVLNFIKAIYPENFV